MTQAVPNILIIGAGQAAFSAVSELQRQHFNGTITLVGNEPHLPYERPPLSKEVLLSDAPSPKDVLLQTQEFYTDLNINLLLSISVVELDVINKKATLSTGDSITFDRCLIATGCSPRPLNELDANNKNVHYFRSWDDAVRFKNSLQATTRLGIIGGGFLGLELASTAQQLGCQVTLFERSARLLPRHAPSFLSDWIKAQAQKNGVELHTNIQDLNIQSEAKHFTISADQTASATVDILAVTIGSIPEDHLAKTAAIPVHPTLGGILVDEAGRTQTADVFAAGDCTTQVTADGQVIRLESWQNANEQGRRAASLMVDIEPTAAAYPWFWTDIFQHNIQMLGSYDPALTYYNRGDLTTIDTPTQLLSIGVKDGIIYHAIAINNARELRPLRNLLEQATPIDINQFLDESVAIRQFAKTATTAHQHANT